METSRKIMTPEIFRVKIIISKLRINSDQAIFSLKKLGAPVLSPGEACQRHHHVYQNRQVNSESPTRLYLFFLRL
jgi:hypothetical protein